MTDYNSIEEVNETVFQMLQQGCVQCGKASDATCGFTPAHPEDFDSLDSDIFLIFFPCCRKCLARGFDLKTAELHAKAARAFGDSDTVQ